jgi:hypothetical protein
MAGIFAFIPGLRRKRLRALFGARAALTPVFAMEKRSARRKSKSNLQTRIKTDRTKIRERFFVFEILL